MADEDSVVDQQKIEALLKQAEGGTPADGASQPAPDEIEGVDPAEIDSLLDSAQAAVGGATSDDLETAQPGTTGDDIQYLLQQAEEAIASIDQPAETDDAPAFELRDLSGSPLSNEKATLDLLSDVEFGVRIELGRTDMLLEDVLKLRRGSVVALDKLAGDPVDIFVNGRLVARGEVLVLNDSFCVRVAELIAGEGT
jgi:flagellar motor switch protein FliN/FliY